MFVRKSTGPTLTPWLSWLSATLQSQGSLVRFLAGAHTWVVGWSLVEAHAGGSRLMYLSHSNVSLPLSPSFPSL